MEKVTPGINCSRVHGKWLDLHDELVNGGAYQVGEMETTRFPIPNGGVLFVSFARDLGHEIWQLSLLR